MLLVVEVYTQTLSSLFERINKKPVYNPLDFLLLSVELRQQQGKKNSFFKRRKRDRAPSVDQFTDVNLKVKKNLL
jgi:hypothetical protein